MLRWEKLVSSTEKLFEKKIQLNIDYYQIRRKMRSMKTTESVQKFLR
jgi:hypothetical protein